MSWVAAAFKRAAVTQRCCGETERDSLYLQAAGNFSELHNFLKKTTKKYFSLFAWPECCSLLPVPTCCFPRFSPRPAASIRERLKRFSPSPPRYVPLLCDSTPDVIKNTTPADGSGQLSATSVRPAIDYPSAGGHKWPVIIWLRNIFPTSDLSLGVNQINPRRALQSMTLQLPMTCSSCTALLLHHWYVGRRDDKRGRLGLWFKSRVAGESCRINTQQKKFTNGREENDVTQWQVQEKKSLLFSFYDSQTWHQLVLCRDGQQGCNI